MGQLSIEIVKQGKSIKRRHWDDPRDEYISDYNKKSKDGSYAKKIEKRRKKNNRFVYLCISVFLFHSFVLFHYLAFVGNQINDGSDAHAPTISFESNSNSSSHSTGNQATATSDSSNNSTTKYGRHNPHTRKPHYADKIKQFPPNDD